MEGWMDAWMDGWKEGYCLSSGWYFEHCGSRMRLQSDAGPN